MLIQLASGTWQAYRGPGENITGLTLLQTDVVAKALEMFKDALPQVTRIGIIWNPTTPSHPPALKAVVLR